ncbi:hypothetical protein, partial [uncultured Prevotella sp.]|uniref:hypothetical protein n=1 Tax=uncultured Prevotella sp. TaxID=159272 RepID=UPI002612AAAB
QRHKALHYGTPLPSPLKRERQFACLRKKLIDKELQDFDKVLQDIQKTFRGCIWLKHGKNTA